MSMSVASEPEFGGAARRMGKMIDQIQKGYYNFYPTETWSPNVNLYETDTSYLVCADLSGVDKEKIDVVIDGQALTLRGTRAVPTAPDAEGGHAAGSHTVSGKLRVHVMEIDHGAFARTVELPQDVDK
ncbi:MAG: Hsp20/alpha crystallin family protein, partial [Tepidisphaeraceae bacterium]